MLKVTIFSSLSNTVELNEHAGADFNLITIDPILKIAQLLSIVLIAINAHHEISPLDLR